MTTGGPSGWDAIAEAYDRLAGTDKDVVYADLRSALWSALGDVRGKWILDVGCGSGWLAAQLADAGAHVVGIDGSAELIRRARARFPAVQWLLHDLRDGLPKLPDHRPIDIVVAHMSVMDFDPLLPLFNDLGFLVPTGSRLIITMPHPRSSTTSRRRKVRLRLGKCGTICATKHGISRATVGTATTTDRCPTM